ncbi:sensor histidine kinase [Paenibacillus mendelii]|uniref:histidine kinase n=1 Tax=Paenibacillus mendelii TaxID=206163 RepID=A0ABV6JKY9_9BACL|nr:HAMP domain-containing sensor histidine kinase [Paenibacillus mendelii]MCQ6560577.1 HAMP domain-containing histidine kinase [Paenibacillus mendelii]
MTVRGKIFTVMAVLVVLVSVAYIGTTQGFLGSLFARYYSEGGGGEVPVEQLEGLRGFILEQMELKAITVTLYVAGITAVVCYWLSGMLVRPLKRLIAVMDRVARRELDAEVPVLRRDEYGQVGEAFNKMTLNLREAENSRKRLVEDVAHELRTPLSIVLSKLELIQQSPSDVKPESLLPLHDEVLRLIRLVDELQLLSSAEAGELILHKEMTDLAVLLTDLSELVLPEAEAYGVHLVVPASGDTVWIHIDARRIKQVFLNLVANALKHTPHGGAITLTISRTEDSGFVSVAVKDTGPGIPPEAIPHLFDRFYQVDKTERRASGGAGLGLAIARQILIAHGGYIEAANITGGGAEFTVFLPVSAVSLVREHR